MDIYCKFCGEPWENDTIHEEVAERGKGTYTQVAREFRRYGCGAFYAFTGRAVEAKVCSRATKSMSAQGREVVAALYDMLGDDMDGAASMIDEAEYLGYLS